MTNNPDNVSAQRFSAVGLILLLASLAPVVAGWITGRPDWITWLSALGVMRFNTALGFLLLIASFFFVLNRNRTRALPFVFALLGLSALTAVQYLFSIDLGIDEFFIKDFMPAEQGKFPGRMSPATTIAFLICGFSCLPSVFRNPGALRFSNILLFLVVGEGIFSLMTVLGLPKNIMLAFSGGLSSQTGLLFLICGISILYTNNSRSSPYSLINWVPLGSFVLLIYLSLKLWFTFKYDLYTTLYQNNYPVDMQFSRDIIEHLGNSVAPGIITAGAVYALLAAFCLYLYFKTRLNRSILNSTSQALELSESRSQAYLDFAPEAIIVVNRDGKIILANKRAESTFGYSAEYLKGRPVECLVPDSLRSRHAEHRRKFAEKPLQRDMGAELDLWAVRSDNSKFPVDVMLGPIHLGKDTMTMAIVRDVTEEKNAEQLIKSALAQQETLLKEVYHRVKNNMQVISSLLKMQARKQCDQPARRALEDSASRVMTMALVHEKLYQSKNLAEVNFSEYAETLLQHLAQTMQDQGEASIETDVANVSFDIDTLIPLGLILSELVSNAYKHAFVSQRSLVIRVSLIVQENSCALTVADNGSGLPDGFSMEKTTSLGMLLVNNLANQLRGKLKVSSDQNGSIFVITFPVRGEGVADVV